MFAERFCNVGQLLPVLESNAIVFLQNHNENAMDGTCEQHGCIKEMDKEMYSFDQDQKINS